MANHRLREAKSLKVIQLGLEFKSCLSDSKARLFLAYYTTHPPTTNSIIIPSQCWALWQTLEVQMQSTPLPTTQFSSVQSLSRVRLFAIPWTAAHQAFLSITNSRVHPNPFPSSQWCHPTISFSVVPFYSCPQSFPASGSFPMRQLFASSGQSIGVSASTSVLPKNIQDWFPSELTGWISLQSKALSRIFSNTTVQKHQFFGSQPSSQSNSHIHTWLLGKP